MMGSNNSEMCQKYMQCMEEIKKRMRVIEAFLAGECSAMYVQTTAESVALQLRKTLELIAFASLVANSTEYRKRRASFHRDWQAKRILEELAKVNPRFYPEPSDQVEHGDGSFTTRPIPSGFLTKDEHIALYDQCSDLLHATNPFASASRDVGHFMTEQVPLSVKRIRVLLNHHHMFPLDRDRMFIVVMRRKTDGNVGMYEFQRLKGP